MRSIFPKSVSIDIPIVYVPRACNKKNLESISPIILVLRHIFLVFGHFEPIQAPFEPP